MIGSLGTSVGKPLLYWSHTLDTAGSSFRELGIREEVLMYEASLQQVDGTS